MAGKQSKSDGELTETEVFERRVKKEKNRLKRNYKGIEDNKRNILESAIDRAAFLTVEAQDLEKKIMAEGDEVVYKNGENQYGTKQSPAIQSYMQAVQKLTAILTLLKSALDKQPGSSKNMNTADPMTEFVSKREG